jgi:hypothetical protein
VKLAECLTDKTLHAEIGYLIFCWEGGAYIDILIRNPETGNVEYTDQCINVYDYSEGKATIPFTTESLINEAVSWMNDRIR